MNQQTLRSEAVFGYVGILIFVTGLMFFPVFTAQLTEHPNIDHMLEAFNPENSPLRSLTLFQLGWYQTRGLILSLTGLLIVTGATFVNYYQPALTWVCGLASFAIPFSTIICVDILQSKSFLPVFDPDTAVVNWLGVSVMSLGSMVMTLSAFGLSRSS